MFVRQVLPVFEIEQNFPSQPLISIKYLQNNIVDLIKSSKHEKLRGEFNLCCHSVNRFDCLLEHPALYQKLNRLGRVKPQNFSSTYFFEGVEMETWSGKT